MKTILDGLAWIVKRPWALTGLVYLVMSMVTYVSYAFDKHAARAGKWRTKEATLHLLELLGGWPGALLAQKYLRHKCRKLSYQIVFWLMVILNLAILWLLI